MVDQIIPPSSIAPYLNYFDDVKVIISERDPRDLYLYEKVELRSGMIPTKDVKEFCKWYEIIRRHRKTEEFDPKKVMLIRFEDWIYNYDKTCERVVEFTEIGHENHLRPKNSLDPAVSINNTKLFRRYPKFKEDIIYIEEQLNEYLYPFPE